ncbi:MAG TPA: polysaccharide biosynthesis tyrosine autokinase [Terriglobales bacterium]|nr:polysaccharide biosynthesis tyrosine autokinase [Terriglobales bacterium]
MKSFPPQPGSLAAEMGGVLLAAAEEHFSPSEMVAALRLCPGWGSYLSDFETERGQSAAIGRFLNDLGLVKTLHHRSRGSLYSRQETLLRLHAVRENEGAAAGDTTAGVAVHHSPGEGHDRLPGTDSEAESAAVGGSRNRPRRRRNDAVAPGVAAGPTSRDSGAAATPARSAPVIGWRRRATDSTQHSRSQTAAAAMPAPPIPIYPVGPAAPAPPPGAPPVWIGGGSAVTAPGYAGGALVPYTGLPEFGAATAADEAGLPLSFYWIQIRRHLFKILLAAAVITGLATFYTLRIPKLYAAVVTLRIDFSTPAMEAAAQANPAFDPTTLIQTEIADATQRSVILDAISSAHLNLDPNLRRELGAGASAVPTTANPNALDDRLVSLIASHTAAGSPNNTNNINLSYRSRDPATSAAVANAMAAALISHEFQTRQQEQDDSLKFMNQQFMDVQARVESEQAALTAYQHQNNILNPDNQSSLEFSTLASLNTTYLSAQAQLTKYQAEEHVLAGGQPTDALLSSDDGAILRPTYDAWRAAQLKFTQVQAARGPANPEYQAAAQAVTAAHTQLQEAMASVKAQIDLQYQRAQEQTALIQKQLNQARNSAQAFNDKAIDYNTQRRNLDADQKLYDNLLAQIKQQQLTSSVSSSNLRVTNPATPNPTPVYPDVPRNAELALMFSLFFGCGLAVLVGYLDRSFTSPDGVEQYLRIPLLGALPIYSGKSSPIELAQQAPESQEAADAAAGKHKGSQRSPFAESVLMLRTALLYSAPHGFRTLSVTSAQPQEGKSVVIANLAISLALHGSKVLLIDGDIRRPIQHRLFETSNQVGLSSLLRQSAPLESCFRATTVEKLYLMPSGPAVPNPSELISTMLAQVLAPLTSEFDYVLVDSPPLLGFADATAIATVVEGTILVARAGKTPRELVQAALQPLQRVRARVLGLVLNQVSSSLSPYYSYYRNHYNRYYGARDHEEENEETNQETSRETGARTLQP